MEALKEKLSDVEMNEQPHLKCFYVYDIKEDEWFLNPTGMQTNFALNEASKVDDPRNALNEPIIENNIFVEPQAELPGIEATLEERGARYGVFAEHARICHKIKDAMRDSPNWQYLDPDMKQALEVIADKAARILNGDFNYIDNWHDITGYATLVEKRLIKDQEPD